MPVARVIKTPLAKEDLIEIWNYIADDNPEQATKLLRTVDQKLKTIKVIADLTLLLRGNQLHFFREKLTNISFWYSVVLIALFVYISYYLGIGCIP